MDSLVKSDIFFFISTIALVIVSIAMTVAIVYIILILRNIKEFSDRAKEEGKAAVEDFKNLREALKSHGKTFKNLGEFIFERIVSKTSYRRKGSKKSPK